MEVDPVVDFQRHHMKRLNPKKIDSNSNTQADFTLESFYRKEFGQVLDTLINLMAENLKSCLSSVQPIYHILSVPLKSTITLEDIKKAFSLFPPGSDLSKVTDFDGILCEINMLRREHSNILIYNIYVMFI